LLPQDSSVRRTTCIIGRVSVHPHARGKHRGISDIDAAHAFLPEFMADLNTRFALAPPSPVDAHRPVLHSAWELALILCLHQTRTLSRNLTFQFKNREYQLQGQSYRLNRAAVTVLHQGRNLPWRLLAEGESPIPLDDEKSVHHAVEQAKARPARQTRAPAHPWRRKARIAAAQAQQQ
jgi:hypothetical protein